MPYAVTVLFDGYSVCQEKDFLANCTCTLIKGEKNIIVDTMTAWDRDKIIRALQENGLQCDDIDFVVSTHGHSDHIGNNNLFLKAVHIVGFAVSFKDTYFDHSFRGGEHYVIDDNVKIIPTPGHTSEDVTVLVNTENQGLVAITGDIFEKKEDIADPTLWMNLAGSENPDKQKFHRNYIISIADWIVPGHGPMFAVTEEMRQGGEDNNNNKKNILRTLKFEQCLTDENCTNSCENKCVINDLVVKKDLFYDMGSIQTGQVIVKEELKRENEYTEADIFDDFSQLVDTVKPEICNEFAVEEESSECSNQIGYVELSDTSDNDKDLNHEQTFYNQDTTGSQTLNVNHPHEYNISNDNQKQQSSCKDNVYENKINDNHPKQQKSSKINYQKGNLKKSTKCKKLSTDKIPLLMSKKKKYVCDICNRPLHSKRQVEYHAVSHKSVKDYICHICDKAFFSNVNLLSHLKVHDRMHIKYTCDVCGKCFTQKCNMRRHFLIHEGTKKFSCYICKKKFLHKVSLSYHLSIHSGSRDKNQICSVCGATFSDKSNLNKHYRKHFTIWLNRD